jgi:sensor domain CHASE-containing protein
LKIQVRTLVILGVTALILFVTLSFIAQLLVLSSYVQIEKQESDSNTLLVMDQIRYESDQLGTKARDWAVWDDTYQFMVNQNRDYQNSVIYPVTTYESLQLNGLLYYDIDGNLVASQGYDLQNKTRTNLSAGTISYFSENLGLLSNTRGGKKKEGVVLLSEGPFLVGMHTILPTSGTGPSHGTLVMLQSLDEMKIASIQNRLHLSALLFDLHSNLVQTDPVISQLSVADAPVTISRVQNEQIFSGFALMYDVFNKPVMLLEVDTQRTISQEMRLTLFSLIEAFLAIGIISLLLIGLLLDRYIITPLTGLDMAMKKISLQRDQAERLPIDGDDEISSMKMSFNTLLQELSDKDTALAEVNRKANLYLDIYLDVLTNEIINVTLSLKQFSDLIRETDSGNNTDQTMRITEALNRNLSVIRNIETILKMYNTPPGNYPVIIEDILKKEIPDHPNQKIRCDGCAITVLADEMLIMVFHNIITNSIRYGGPNLDILVSARDNYDGTVEVSMIDNGEGIPDEIKPRIFDRFLTPSVQKGSYGPGLHIVKLLIEAYGGRIQVDDRVPGHPDKGTVIRFTLKKA